ncbi:polysaccharide export protein EpsE [Piscinibacter sakaiensis]|uniref:polysaccharide export protein EpsE n=1 Tax=Piscinibacter sakaiensis TaxID=1547922 RepID=UPI003AAEB448
MITAASAGRHLRASTLVAVMSAGLAIMPFAVNAQPATRASASTAAAPAAEYTLGGGDVVRISVYQNPDLNIEARISEAGVISFPLLGSLPLGGRSVSQAEALIANGLRNGGFVKQPQVSVLVMQVRGNQANVLGQVNRPGRFPLELAGMRISDLLALAGGVNPNGSDIVTLVRQGANGTTRTEIDVQSLFSSTSQGEDLRVVNGDTIYVDRAPMFYIYGEVQRPGAARLERNMTVMQGLATGGGLTQRGTERGVKVHRRDADGRITVIQPKLNDPLHNGDVIHVQESLF